MSYFRLLLRRGRVDHQPIELRRHMELAAQAAVGFARRRRGLKHRVLILGHRLQPRQELFFDVDVASGALAVAAAFGDDPVDAVLDGAFHDSVADRNVNGARGSGV